VSGPVCVCVCVSVCVREVEKQGCNCHTHKWTRTHLFRATDYQSWEEVSRLLLHVSRVVLCTILGSLLLLVGV
jgi:hypothetical protein